MSQSLKCKNRISHMIINYEENKVLGLQMYLFQEALLCNDNKDFWWNSLKKFRNKPRILSGKLTNNRLVCEYFTVINTLAFEIHEWIPLQNYHIGPRPNGLLGLESNPFIQMWQIKKVFSFKKS